MQHTLLIHMGIPKTGTSALQLFLFENRKKLEEYGWCYPDLKEEASETQFFRWPQQINGGVFYKEKRNLDTTSANWIKAWESTLRYLENYNVIISEERFFLWGIREFLTEAKKEYRNIKVILYLRRQDRALESFWNQKVKNPIGCCQTFQEFFLSDPDGECALYHYKQQLDAISGIIGKENLIVRIYEKGQLGGKRQTTESDFLSVLGIEPNWEEWKSVSPQNLRLGENYLAIRRIFNSLRLVEGFDNGAENFQECFLKLSKTFSGTEQEKGCLLPEERKKFLEQYSAENEEIAREYLHREDGRLFYDTTMDYPLYASCTPLEEGMIRIFSALLYSQNGKVKRLRDQSCILAEKLLLANGLKGRRLLLFGAGNRCQTLLNRLKTPVDLLADNNKAKKGKRLNGVEIAYALEIKNWPDYFVIVTCEETDEIEKQLQRLGLKKEDDYILAKEYFACF